MKNFPTVMVMLFFTQYLSGQNLVSNPGFETNSGLPTGVAQYYLATGWNNCNGIGSPDYFHTQGTGQVQLPNCFVGSVNPNTGDACIGGASYYYSPPDFREYLSSQLITPLVIGSTYNVNLYVTNGTTSGTYGGGGIDNISVAFSVQPLTQSGTDPILVTPQVTYGTVYYSYTWQLLTMQFVADSAYDYLTIGNFSTDANTVYQQFDPCPNFGAYYFFDDLAVEEAASAPVALFNAPNHICPGSCIDFNNTSVNATSYIWSFTGANPSVSTDMNPTSICYNTPGNYTVELIATNSITSDTLTLTNYITVYAFPSPQGILQSGDTLFANQGAVSYQWYFNGTLIPGATDYYYVASSGGNYNIVATDANGCEVEAAIFDVTAGLTPALSKGEGVAVYPNPVVESFTIICYPSALLTTDNKISIYNMIGEKMPVDCNPDNYQRPTADCKLLTPGMYMLEIVSGEKIYRIKFLKN
jgi:PKD repeat protein